MPTSTPNPCTFAYFFKTATLDGYGCPKSDIHRNQAAYVAFENGFAVWSVPQNEIYELITVYVKHMEVDAGQWDGKYYLLGGSNVRQSQNLVDDLTSFVAESAYGTNLGQPIEDSGQYEIVYQSSEPRRVLYFSLPESNTIIEQCLNIRSSGCPYWRVLDP